MLTIDDYRRILGHTDLTDDQLWELQQVLRGLAILFVEMHLKEKFEERRRGLTHRGSELS